MSNISNHVGYSCNRNEQLTVNNPSARDEYFLQSLDFCELYNSRVMGRSSEKERLVALILVANVCGLNIGDRDLVREAEPHLSPKEVKNKCASISKVRTACGVKGFKAEWDFRKCRALLDYSIQNLCLRLLKLFEEKGYRCITGNLKKLLR